MLRSEEIVPEDLPIEISKSATSEKGMESRSGLKLYRATVDLRELITLFERGLRERAMAQSNGVQAEAA